MARPYDYFPLQTFRDIPSPSTLDRNKALTVNSDGNALVYTPLTGRKNLIINGNFDIWQRGTSQTSSGYGSADRWFAINNGTTKTASQQTSFTLGQTDVPDNPSVYMRHVVSSVAGASNYCLLQQRIENVRTASGVTVTLSFWAKADASKNIAIDLVQSFGTGGSPSTFVSGIGAQQVSLTTSWAKYTLTIDVPSISGETLGTDGNHSFWVNFWFDAGSTYDTRTASLGQQSGTFDIAQVQLEIGEEATAFEQRSYGEELALCQRYYQKSTVASGILFSGNVVSGGDYLHTVYFPTAMRVAPTVTPAYLAVLGFAATVPTIGNIDTVGFISYKTSNSTVSDGFFQANWTADAEL